MKKMYKSISLTLLSIVFYSAMSNAQTATLFSENFDAAYPNMPTGWTAPNAGWKADTTNPSTGYMGATGNANLVIRNQETTGVYELITPAISTIGHENITILWGTRLTVNFPTNGSAVQSVALSVDNGATWTNLTYTENSNNSVWSLNNNGSRISLPASANDKSNVKIKWTVSIVNHTDGTYRIDDFDVKGTVIPSSLSDITKQNAFEFATLGDGKYSLAKKDHSLFNAEYAYYNLAGQLIKKEACSTASHTLDVQEFPSGIYIINIWTDNKIHQIKISK